MNNTHTHTHAYTNTHTHRHTHTHTLHTSHTDTSYVSILKITPCTQPPIASLQRKTPSYYRQAQTTGQPSDRQRHGSLANGQKVRLLLLNKLMVTKNSETIMSESVNSDSRTIGLSGLSCLNLVSGFCITTTLTGFDDWSILRTSFTLRSLGNLQPRTLWWREEVGVAQRYVVGVTI